MATSRPFRKSTPRRNSTAKQQPAGALPRPTASEAAFERIFAALRAGERAAAQALGDTPALVPVPLPSPLEELFARRDDYLVREPFANIGESIAFNTKVVGVSFEGRQSIVAGLVGNETVELVRQSDNPHDPNAIAVRYGALQLGYLRKEIARKIAPNIDAGERYVASVSGVTGGRDGKHTGVNLRVRRQSVTALRVETQRPASGASHGDDVRIALIGDRPVREAQADALTRVQGGGNTLAVMGTGRGKSFCFQLPAAARALEQRQKTLVFYPLRALANDQHDVLQRKLGPLGVRIFRANGAIDGEERDTLEDALGSGEWDIILSTPEFAEYHREAFLRTWNRPSLVVVDEAHHLYDAKHRPAYGALGGFIDALGGPQVLALTATANDHTFAHLRKVLRIERWVIDPTVRENLHVVEARNVRDKAQYIQDALHGEEKAIVYCTSRSESTKVAVKLRAVYGDVVAFYHAQVPAAQRILVEDLFRSGGVRIVVATSAFGEGIDLPDVRHVFLYHLNFSFTEFNQQAGRAGRDGLAASIHLLYGAHDRRINDYIIAQEAPTIGKLRELYRGMRGLAGPDGLRMTYEDVARTLEIELVTGRTVSRAVRIFEDAALVEMGVDDDGRFVRFLEPPARVDLTRSALFAEGEAERETFDRFCSLALDADAATLEAIVNRPIYPDGVAVLR